MLKAKVPVLDHTDLSTIASTGRWPSARSLLEGHFRAYRMEMRNVKRRQLGAAQFTLLTTTLSKEMVPVAPNKPIRTMASRDPTGTLIRFVYWRQLPLP